MNSEIMQLKFMIAETKKQIKGIDLEAKGLILAIRTYINPYETLENMKSDEALSSMNRLHTLLTERKEKADKLDTYLNDLGSDDV